MKHFITVKKLSISLVVIIVVLCVGYFGLRLAHINPVKWLTRTPKPVKTVTSLIELNERTVNLLDTANAHYLKFTVAIEMTGPSEGQKLADENKIRFNDCIIDVTTRYSYFSLLSEQAKLNLKDELQSAFNNAIHVNGENADWKVTDVLFTDFVME